MTIAVATKRDRANLKIMSQKELAMEAIADLPDDCTLDQIAEKLRYLGAIREGMEELDKGLEIDHKDVKKKLAEWLST